MPNTLYESPTGTYQLVRPGINPKQSLKAWDAADEYLISVLNEQFSTDRKVAILNDQFGALGTCLNHFTGYWVSDSFCAHQALKTNLLKNNITKNYQCVTPLSEWPETDSINTAVIKLPKNLSYLTFLLEKCQANNINTVYIAGMIKHLPKTILQFLQKYGIVERLPFKKKATIYQLTIDKLIESPYPKRINISGLNISGHANVFGRDRLDPGASFVLESLDKLPNAHKVADLCSGSGILGVAYLNKFPESDMHFIDESHMAVISSQESCELNISPKQTYHWDDGLTNCEENFDLIICNPPFHEEHTVGTHIANRLFKDAKQHLNKNGSLVVIANRHLGYHVSLKKYFSQVTTLASNSKFVLLKANG